MKWTTTIAALTVLQDTADLAHAKTAGVRRNRQLQDDYFYPTDITQGICSNDSSVRPSSYTEIGFTLFETMEECCLKWYDWQQAGNCLRNEPVSAPKEVVPVKEPAATTTESESTPSETTPDDTVLFYPMDLVTGRCSSDASQRPSNFDSIGFTLFFTRELCCQYWFGWQEDQTCLLNTSTEIPSFVTPGEDPTDAPGGGNSGSDGQSGDKFYLVDDVCGTNTNGVMVWEVFFATKFDCCTNILDFDMRKNCCNESVDDPGAQLECLLIAAADPIEATDPAGEGGDPAVQGGGDPVVIEDEEQFYVSDRNCYSTADGVSLEQSLINRVGTMYSSRFECCNSLSKEDRHACVWENDTASAKEPPSSASHFAMGGYVIAIAVCLCFQFM